MAPINHSANDSANMMSSDQQQAHLLLRYLPRSLVPYALLARWDRPIGVWLMLLPALWGLCLAAPELPTLRLWLLFLLGAWAMRGAGCTINDLFDRKLDVQVTRTAARPLAAGTVTVQSGWLWLMLQSVVGLVVLLQLPAMAQLAGLVAVPLIIIYPLMKRITWWPQAWLGITFNWGFWVGVAVYTQTLQPHFYLFYLGAICWTLGYDTIYAVQDRADDAQIGVRSTARLWGKHAPRFIYIMYGLALLLWGTAGYWLQPIYWLGWSGAAFTALWLLIKWQPDELLSAHRAFVRNQYIGLAILIGIILCQ